jgi:hypothetical protein
VFPTMTESSIGQGHYYADHRTHIQQCHHRAAMMRF